MNCRSFRRRQAELLDVRLDPAATADLLQHAATCPRCKRELSEMRAIMVRMTPSGKPGASKDLKERIMSAVTVMDTANRVDCESRSPAASLSTMARQQRC